MSNEWRRSWNSVEFRGRIVSEPVLHETRKGRPIVTVSVGIYCSRQFGREPHIARIRVVAAGENATQMAELGKGRMIHLRGRFDTDARTGATLVLASFVEPSSERYVDGVDVWAEAVT